MMRKPAKKSVSRTSNGRYAAHENQGVYSVVAVNRESFSTGFYLSMNILSAGLGLSHRFKVVSIHLAITVFPYGI